MLQLQGQTTDRGFRPHIQQRWTLLLADVPLGPTNNSVKPVIFTNYRAHIPGVQSRIACMPEVGITGSSISLR